jgi:aminomuconate-semialdehyde/2-hydroxymuconate-6-semialdehyde dehydrogenase
MNSILDFIQSLQEMKKSQLKWANVPLAERAQALQNLSTAIQENSQSLAQKISEEENLPFDFVLKNEIQVAARHCAMVSAEKPSEHAISKPTGLISILLPESFAFRILIERLAPALLAGNGVFILASPQNPAIVEFLNKNLDPAVLPVRVFLGGEDLSEIMAAHPGIQAVSFFGLPEKAEKILKSVSGTWKKWQITSGYHNSALVMSDADLKATAEKLVESCFVGLGRLPWNISTIYVTESQLADFQNEFINALEKTKFAELDAGTRGRMDRLHHQLRLDKAKVLFGGEPGQPLVVEDLSHCSVLQQDCLNAPIVLISPVKYVHEMVKWANTSYFGMYAQIFGSPEKVEKFAKQLDVSRVSANGWIEQMSTLPLGLKQSFSGLPSLDAFGNFFSDCGKIDGLETKS